MCFWWLITLVIYGAWTGRDIDHLFWWLLIPMVIQDFWDLRKK